METEEPYWSEPYLDEGGGGIIMTTYSHPMHAGRDGNTGKGLRAIVTADISLAYLNELGERHSALRVWILFRSLQRGGVRNELSIPGTGHEYLDFRCGRRARTCRRAGACQGHAHPTVGILRHRRGVHWRRIIRGFHAHRSPGWTLGAVLPKKEVFAGVDAIHKETIALACMGTVLLLIAAVLVARSISRPLQRMAQEAVKVADGDLDVDLSDIRSTDEVGQLARSFTEMTQGLKERERIKDTFGRYVTREVVKRLLDSKDGLKLGGENPRNLDHDVRSAGLHCFDIRHAS